MNHSTKLSAIGALLISMGLAGCAHDDNTPGTLQQQNEMARGHQPTKEQLDAAMSRFKTPGSASATPIPPQGAAPGKSTKPPGSG